MWTTVQWPSAVALETGMWTARTVLHACDPKAGGSGVQVTSCTVNPSNLSDTRQPPLTGMQRDSVEPLLYSTSSESQVWGTLHLNTSVVTSKTAETETFYILPKFSSGAETGYYMAVFELHLRVYPSQVKRTSKMVSAWTCTTSLLFARQF